MSPTNNRKEAFTSGVLATKKLSQEARKKWECDYEQIEDETSSGSEDNILDDSTKHNNVFNPPKEEAPQGRMFRKRIKIKYAESDAETNSGSDYDEKKSKQYGYKPRTKLGKAFHVNTSEERSKPSRHTIYHSSGLREQQESNMPNNYSEVGSQFLDISNETNLENVISYETPTKDYSLYMDGVSIRPSIKISRQSTNYVAEINKQDLLYHNIIDTTEPSATRVRVIFKDKWIELISTIESIINSEESRNEEPRNVKKYIKEFMDKITTRAQLEDVIKNEKVKSREYPNKEYEKQAFKLAKIFIYQFEDYLNKFLEEQTEYSFIINFVSQIFKLLFKDKKLLKLDWGVKTLKASAILKNELLQDDYKRSHGNMIDLVMSIVDIELECVILEVSGSPNEQDHAHYVSDRNKIAKMLKIIMNYITVKYPGDFEVLRKIKLYGVQIYNYQFYVYSMCMPFLAMYYFKLEFKFECPIRMRTLFRELPKFGQNLWKMRDLIQSSVTEIMKYIDSESEESDGAILVNPIS